MRLEKIHALHIYLTEPQSRIKLYDFYLCSINREVVTAVFSHFDSSRKVSVYIPTRALKHMYDKRPAVAYDFILVNLRQIVCAPDFIYFNKIGKRGSYIFRKDFNGKVWVSAVEQIGNKLYVATCFRLGSLKYLKNYNLIWSREDGDASSYSRS